MTMALRPGRKGGRPWGPLLDGTPDCHRLANWLRERVQASGKTLRDLGHELPYSKDAISRSLNGAKVPEWNLVRALVGAVTPTERHARQLADAEARRLWELADRSLRLSVKVSSSNERPDSVLSQVTSDLVRAYREADEYRRHAQLATEKSQSLVSGLLFVLGGFSTTISVLTEERDRLREDSEKGLAVKLELEINRRQLAEIEQRLVIAEEKRQRAERQLAQAQQQLRLAGLLGERAAERQSRLLERLVMVDGPWDDPEERIIESPRGRDVPPYTLMDATDQEVADKIAREADRLLGDTAEVLDGLGQQLGQSDEKLADGPSPQALPHVGTQIADRAVIAALSSVALTPWQCIAELVDLAVAIQRSSMPQDSEVDPLTINIALPNRSAGPGPARIRVADNGQGLSGHAVIQLIKGSWIGRIPNGAENSIGLGLILTAAHSGSKVTVRSTRPTEVVWTEATFDLRANSSGSHSGFLISRDRAAEANFSGTEFILEDLKPHLMEYLNRRQHQLVAKLGDIYSHQLDGGVIELTINGTKVAPRRHCVWSEDRSVIQAGRQIPAVIRVDHRLDDLLICQSCDYSRVAALEAALCESCGGASSRRQERRIWGWLGIQRYVDPTDFGIDFLRHGRKILTRDRRAFSWEDPDTGQSEIEYPLDIPHAGRIVGEIHCDHLAVNHSKDAFQFDSRDWALVLRIIRGDGPLRPTIAKRLGYPENTSPLGLLFKGFRRSTPGLRCLVPGDGRTAIHETAREWGRRFHRGEADYQDDRLWYEAAVKHDAVSRI
ncbi:hypothetical protein O7634_13120 [Micromonospora sp. WMMD1120]|uniref:hypothetical protein n=1 Tax=Micromonospora sp. WMMD1120 TaxID=3016106 RepID=UPI002416CDE4|nr:hypothetical protein [Micromonospora sp. WMMD1120]MDG4807692.1 hypothetical protein [Micromonospora sp. WMMD1120]